jgi:hypothetical protein
VIDGVVYDGQLTSAHILDKVCEKLEVKPPVCTHRDFDWRETEDERDELALGLAIGFLVFWTIAIIVCIVFSVRYVRAKMSTQLREVTFTRSIN